MKPIIEPVDRKLIEQELTDDKFIRFTNFGNNKIYVVNYHNSPNVMREIGRLREIAFREAGGGTGKELDIDKYDTAEVPYEQLIVWSTEYREILGGYRFIYGKNAPKDENGHPILATTGLLEMSDKFINEYLPYTIELGRSFVQPNFQASKQARLALYTLDNLWDGLGALIELNKGVKYFFGKVTMYRHFNTLARDYILYFLNLYFGDKEKLVYPKEPIQITTPEEELSSIFVGDNYKKDYRALSQKVRSLGENIPPLINSYMNLSPSMKVFGTAINHHFGGVEETGILITISDIYQEKRMRHLTFSNDHIDGMID